jgi:hypothetical protein
MATQAEFEELWRDTRAELRSLVDGYVSGHLTASDLGDRMVERLEDGHTAAGTLGRSHAGDDAPADADDRKFAEQIVDGETEYLARFVQDLEDGRYRDEHGNEDTDAIGDRAASYANRMTGTANEAFALSSPDAEFDWVLGGENNCDDCPDLAAGSPYTAENLPPPPGSNETACLFNCNCELVRSDGVSGFTVPTEED